ncbi:sugar transferase [Clostridium hydrogeniformans]|uniref:sugar transferase n=1 Tax=Clostridium hydrogeniformans TaxID=349933 RepID=UPI0004835856|nr:sugar transferase [Clostridium hydrogeniformans]
MQLKEINIDSTVEQKPVYDLVKRLFDIISATLALIIFSPLFIILAIIVKLDSKGPVFFGHKRLGFNGELIKVYKFRTMYENSAELFEKFTPEQKREFEINFKLDDDPRITKIGDFLRKSSLDELPQLVNIIKGDMSVVGPRPIVEKEVEKYGEYIGKLLKVKPGLTGNWQANGRSDTTYEERVQMDMDYIDNRSFGFDIKIIFQTVLSVLKGKGAV